MDCKEAQILLAPHIMGDLDSDSRSHELEVHLFSCQGCSQEYKAIKETMEFIDEHKALFAEAFETIEKNRVAEQEEMKRNWQGIEAKLDKIEAQERKEKQTAAFRTLWKVTAAACLIIGVSVWLVVSNPKTPEKRVSRQIPSPLATAIKIELLSNSGSTPLPAGRDISTSADKLKTLLINGRHRLVMKADSTLAIEPFEQDGHLGCMVRLSLGEIFAHVEHNGNPFVVSTTHGRAVITGTTFDIKATNDSTMLVVAEGTVQFESEKGTVKVEAGQISQIVAKSAPTQPVSCNAAELTAWATGMDELPEMANTIADQELDKFIEELPLPLTYSGPPIDLESLDYDRWVAEKRDWFKGQFPWIFELRNALVRERIEVDYPELLIKSGDIWQIVYPERLWRIIPVIDPNSLLAVAKEYDIEKTALSQTMALVGRNQLKHHEMAFGIAAIERWLSECRTLQNASVSTKHVEAVYGYSLSIGEYLENTRALIWLCVQNSVLKVPEAHKAEVLSLLQKQLVKIYTCKEMAWYLSSSSDINDSSSGCGNNLRKLIDAIEEIKGYEQHINHIR